MKKLTFLALLICSCSWFAAGQVASPPATSADDVVAKMYVRDRQREKVSQGYAGNRRYIFDNQGLHKHAELEVAVQGDADGSKHFTVIAEQGWKLANKHVLQKMVESEAENSRPNIRLRTLLTPENYSFTLLKTEVVENRPTYVIAVTPKRRDKYLFEGRIWVDGIDYAMARVEGKPAANPSFWTRSIHFTHRYQKNGDYWYPTATESVTQAWIFGKTEVTIRYFDYTPHIPSTRAAAYREKTSIDEVTYDSH